MSLFDVDIIGKELPLKERFRLDFDKAVERGIRHSKRRISMFGETFNKLYPGATFNKLYPIYKSVQGMFFNNENFNLRDNRNGSIIGATQSIGCYAINKERDYLISLRISLTFENSNDEVWEFFKEFPVETLNV